MQGVHTGLTVYVWDRSMYQTFGRPSRYLKACCFIHGICATTEPRYVREPRESRCFIGWRNHCGFCRLPFLMRGVREHPRFCTSCARYEIGQLFLSCSVAVARPSKRRLRHLIPARGSALTAYQPQGPSHRRAEGGSKNPTPCSQGVRK